MLPLMLRGCRNPYDGKYLSQDLTMDGPYVTPPGSNLPARVGKKIEGKRERARPAFCRAR